MLWERWRVLSDQHPVPGPLFLLRACQVHCGMPCDLVDTGPQFGILNATTGRTAYNLTQPHNVTALANGVSYWVELSAGIRSHPGVLHASACGGKGSWSAPLPTEAGSGSPSRAWQRIIVTTDHADKGRPVVITGGHIQGPCSRGGCQPGHSAYAVFRIPRNVTPAPLVPPTPTQSR